VARLLLFPGAAAGHVAPFLPISSKLVERRHEVVWISGRVFAESIVATGARYEPLPEALDPGEKQLYEVYPELWQLRGLRQLKWYVKHVFLDGCAGQVEAIDAVLGRFEADVLVGDNAIYGVYFKAEQLGKPSLMVSVTPLALSSRDTPPFGLGILPAKGRAGRARDRLIRWFGDHVLLDDLAACADRTRGRLGLPPTGLPFTRAMFEYPTLVAQLSTPAFEYPRSDAPTKLHFVGPAIAGLERPFSPPAWWEELGSGRPVVFVTQGTVATSLHELIAPALAGLEDQNVLVVVVPLAEGALPALPSNARAAPFVPFERLLPHVEVMVTNGGYGGVQLALAHGVPVIVAGATEEKMEVAARVRWSGAGISLGRRSPSPARIRDAVAKVLSQPSYLDNARRIQRDFARYDAPTLIAELIESLVAAE
jgi:MGT family glycosyltransferase